MGVRDAAGLTVGSDIEVHPATIDRLEDALDVLNPGRGEACLCQYWRVSAGEFAHADMQARNALLAEQLSRSPAEALLAYVDGEPVGWVEVAPRARLERLVRSKTIPAVDDAPVWSIVCFRVKVGYRRRGVARALLAAAVEHARANGAPAVEAYPIDPDGTRVEVGAAYVGTVGMFARAGFSRVLETTATSAHRPRWLMRLDLADEPRSAPQSV